MANERKLQNMASRKTALTPSDDFSEDPRLSAIRKGDLSVFDSFYHDIVPALLRFAQRIGPAYMAEDIIQDVMLDIWQRRETLVVRGSLRGYVFGAVRLRIADRVRYESATASVNEKLVESINPVAMGGSPAESPVAHTEAQELEAAVREALGKLPHQARMILTLRWIEGFKYIEIASALGISVDAAKKQGRRMEVIIQDLLSRFKPNRS